MNDKDIFLPNILFVNDDLEEKYFLILGSEKFEGEWKEKEKDGIKCWYFDLNKGISKNYLFYNDLLDGVNQRIEKEDMVVKKDIIYGIFSLKNKTYIPLSCYPSVNTYRNKKNQKYFYYS